MKVYNNKKGVISVFLIIIFTALLMFAGLIIDLCRVMVAERKVENALDTAVRSVLAEYDTELVGQFGLYGVAPGVKEEELERYFRVNLLERHKNFNFINYKIEKVEISSIAQKSMLNDVVFKEQIRQYMKYKGPLLLTENVVDVFLKGSFDKKADLLNVGKDASRDFKKIEQSKDVLNSEIKKVTALAKGSVIEKIVTVENIKSGVGKLMKLAQKTQEKTELANAQITEIKEETNKFLLAEEQEALVNVQRVENEEDLEKLKEKLAQLQADLEFNQGILKQIASLEKESASLDKKDRAREIALYNQKMFLYEQLRSLEPLDFAEKAAAPEPLSKKEIEAKDGLVQALEKLMGRKISADNPVTLLIKPEYFAEANQKSSEGKTAGLTELEFDEQMGKLSGDNDFAENTGTNIFNYLYEMNQQIQQIARSGKDKMYFTEYILDKYTFVTSPVKRGHYFEQGEVEYLLCGNKNERLNISQVFFRIWSMRFALNAVDSFFLNPLPSFTVRLGKALVEGFIYATKDLLAMYGGKNVPLCASLEKAAVRLSYADHLRLLLLLQREKPQLERMRQLIQINLRQVEPNFELKNHAAIITGKAEVTMNLWFAPLLQLDKLGFKQIQGSNYHLLKTATLGY
ncbi:MAG: DUF5702 domain-containing protein [Clostridia bacterium]|nr:DUF5702 domain-containing protein [Clostridia bacterium]